MDRDARWREDFRAGERAVAPAVQFLYTAIGTGHRDWDGTPGLGRDTGTGTGTPGLGRGHRDWDGTPGLGRDTGLCTTEPFCTTERPAVQRNEPVAVWPGK